MSASISNNGIAPIPQPIPQPFPLPKPEPQPFPLPKPEPQPDTGSLNIKKQAKLLLDKFDANHDGRIDLKTETTIKSGDVQYTITALAAAADKGGNGNGKVGVWELEKLMRQFDVGSKGPDLAYPMAPVGEGGLGIYTAPPTSNAGTTSGSTTTGTGIAFPDGGPFARAIAHNGSLEGVELLRFQLQYGEGGIQTTKLPGGGVVPPVGGIVPLGRARF